MGALKTAIGLFVAIVLLVTAWRMAFPPESAVMREAQRSAGALGEPTNLTEHVGLRSTAVCGEAGGQPFVYVNGQLHSLNNMPAEQLEALTQAWCS